MITAWRGSLFLFCLCIGGVVHAAAPESTLLMPSSDQGADRDSFHKVSSWPGGLDRAPEKPNIILIVADDFGYENVAANGGESYETPSIDSLAAGGVRFTNAFAQPVCTPSRVKLMTGRYNVRNYTRFGRLDRGEYTFGNLLQSAGYATAVAGKWQLGTELDSPAHFGFDESLLWQHTVEGRLRVNSPLEVDSRYPNPELQRNGQMVTYDEGEYGPQVCTDFIMEFIEKHRDGPFFVYYPMILTHSPMEPTPGSSAWDPQRLGSTNLIGDLNSHQEYFRDMVRYADKLVGDIDTKLQSLGIREKTLLIFTGDNGNDVAISSVWNGISVAGGKRRMGDSGTRVPLIASWPGVIPTGQTRSGLIDLADFLPTFQELSRAALPQEVSIDGQSFLPGLLGEPWEGKEQIYIWSPGQGTAVRNERHRVVYDHRSGEYLFYDDSRLFQPVPLDRKELDEQLYSEFQRLIDYMDTIDSSSSVLPVGVFREWWRIKIYFTEIYEEFVKLLERRFG